MCERIDCQNKGKSCFKCYDYAFYKEPVIKNSNRKYMDKNAKDSWKKLESDVASDLSKLKSGYEAKRQIRSGALPFAPGDVSDSVAFLECKERTPTEANGTKSFTVSKDWLDKAEIEAKEEDKPMFLPFRFKGDEEIYTVTKWEYIAELITTIKSLMLEADKQELILKQLKERLNNNED